MTDHKRKHDAVDTVTDFQRYIQGEQDLATFLGSLPVDIRSLDNWPRVFGSNDAKAELRMVQLFDEDDWRYLYTLFAGLPLDVRPQFKMFNKVCTMPRNVGFFAGSGVAGYSYARQTSVAKPITEELVRLTALVNAICGSAYNGILVNQYAPDGSIGSHSDDETGLSPRAGVVALSVGATRTMRFSTKTGEVHDVVMPPGSVMCMHGANFQQKYQHGIKALCKRDQLKMPIDVPRDRYSATWRQHTVKK